ncbi:MAG TPA: hypothetical protein VH475_20125, partial [Tepidisphaeraceae bacterium]
MGRAASGNACARRRVRTTKRRQTLELLEARVLLAINAGLVNGTISVPGERDRYSFALTSDAKLYFDALSGSGSIHWSLDGPGGRVVNARPFTSSDGGSIANPVLVLSAGDYTLSVDADADTTGDYSFNLKNFTDATQVTPGSAVSGTLDPANETDLYQFNVANAGDKFSFDNLTRTGAPSAVWRLIDPFGQVKFTSDLGTDVSTQAFTVPGTYDLLVEGRYGDTGTGSYSFNIVPQGNDPIVPVTGTPLVLGNTVNGNLATAGAEDVYTFSLAAASRLYFDSGTNGDFNWSLEGPPGTIVNGRDFRSSDASEAGDPVLRLGAGNYVLRVRGAATGNYQFTLRDLAVATPLTFGTRVDGTLAPARTSAFYSFSAVAGDALFFDTQASSGFGVAPTFRLLDPFGNIVFSQGFSDVDRMVIPRSGAYTLLVEGRFNDTSASATFGFTVQKVSDPTTPMTVGTTVNGSIDQPGQQPKFTLNLASDAKLYFDALASVDFTWSMTGPRGTVVSVRSFQGSDAGEFTGNPALELPAGAYTISVDADGDKTGNFSFRLLDFAGATAYTPGTTESNSLTPARSTRVYAFDASAGDRFYFDTLGTTGFASTPSWRLLDPFGNPLFLQGFADVGVTALPRSGTYHLLIEGRFNDNAASGDYSFNVRPVVDATTPITVGATVNGTIASAGQQQKYTLNLASDAKLYFDSLVNVDFSWSMTGPRGTVVGVRSFQGSDAGELNGDPTLDLPAGTYTISVSGGGATTGNFSFRLLDFAAATAYTPGSDQAGTLTPGKATTIYRFDGSAGSRFYFDALGTTGFTNTPSWRLLDPFGNPLFLQGFADVGATALPRTGTYFLLVEGRFFDTSASGNYTFNVRPVNDVTTPITVGATVNGSIGSAGQQQRFTFNLASGARLYFDSLVNRDFAWSLTGPRGTVVSNRSFQGSDAADFGIADPTLNLPAGNYTITVSAGGDATGAFGFRLLDFAAATAYTPGTTESNTLAPGLSTRMYTFQAGTGDRFYFDALGTTGFTNTPSWRLLDPFGNSVFLQSVSDVDVTTLTRAGTYFLLVEGRFFDTSASGDYSFNVRPVTDGTTPINIGATVNSSIASAGQRQNFTFTLGADSRLYFDSLANVPFAWSLSGPRGTVVSNRSFQGSDATDFTDDPVLSLAAGAYTLTVDAGGDATGAFAFRLLDLSAATLYTPGNVQSGTLSPANSTDVYRFTAQAGDQFSFDQISATGFGNTPSWRLLDPFENPIFDQGFSDIGTTTLTRAGEYLLLVEGRFFDTSAAGNYSFNVLPQGNTPVQPFTGDPLTMGSTVNGTIGAAGEVDTYVFTLASNASLVFDSLTGNSNLNWTLEGPARTLVGGRAFRNSDSFDFAPNPLIGAVAGQYRLTVRGGGGNTGPYAFRLLDLASAAAPMSLDADVTGTLTPGNSTNVHTFT